MGDDRCFRIVPSGLFRLVAGTTLHHQPGETLGHELRFFRRNQLAGVPDLVGNQSDDQFPVRCPRGLIGFIGNQRCNGLLQITQPV